MIAIWIILWIAVIVFWRWASVLHERKIGWNPETETDRVGIWETFWVGVSYVTMYQIVDHFMK